MIIKCKMCGGDIEFTPGETYGTCEYCGSTSTIPKAEDEAKLNRYNRANHFRRQCEFDKALAAYEKLLEQDDTDAEAHWGAVISRYGIEYVEDPATGRRVPTCHRVQVASILADADYLAAVENAPDAESRRLYEAQAAEIAEIQKGILAISANEKPGMRHRAAQAEEEGAVGPGAASLLKRARLFMGDGAFGDAATYLDRVLDIDPECAEVYAAKVCVKCGLRRETELAGTPYLYDELPDWKKALRFANPRQKAVYEGYAAAVHERVAQQQRDRAYDCAMEMATNPKASRKKLDDELEEYRNGCSWHENIQMHGSRRDGAQENEQRFDRAVQANDPGKISKQRYLTAEEMFRAIGDERAAACAEQCQRLARQAELAATGKKRNCIIGAVILTATVAAFLVVTKVIIPGNHYEKAEALLAEGQYQQASEAFAQAGSYKDAASRVLEPYYVQAEALQAAGQHQQASEAFAQAGRYKDAVQRRKETSYAAAEALLAAGQYQQASDAFAQAGNYKDAAERTYYVQAEALLAAGDERGAAIYLATIDCHDALKQSYAIRYSGAEASISAGDDHTVGLKQDGTAVAVGWNYRGRCNVSDWRDIVAVEAGATHTVGLKRDGTVVAVGDNGEGQCDVSGWQDIVAASAGFYYTVGLKRDGTVVATGWNLFGVCNVSSWRKIVAVATGGDYTVGLKRDGTVVAVGRNDDGQCEVSGWSDIVAVAAGGSHTVGLKRDGTVVAVGDNGYGKCDVSGWSDIVAVAAGYYHTVGLKRDGTVVAVGNTESGRCNVSGWSDIVAIAAGKSYTVGLKRDGTVVAAGVGSECDVSGWTDIGGGLTLE